MPYSMIKDIKESPLYHILNPESIAFFGASNRFTAMGTSQLVSILSLGYEGRVYPIHPREEMVQGLKAYKNVMEIPDVPDLAVIVLPTKIVSSVLEECGKKGIKHAIIISGGFKEIGEQGHRLEQELISVSRRYGIRMLGPNCIGIVNPHLRLNTTFIEYTATPGFIGMASQSGSFITQMSSYLSQFQLGFSAGISVGNEADIDIVDCMDYLFHCPNTKVIGLYIETIRRGREFIELARKIVPHKPIVAFYAGGSEAGKRASLSHTGALAGPDKLYDGVFRQAGVIRANSIEELFDFCWVLGKCPLPGGDRVIIQTHSGGPGAVTADACERSGLRLPYLSPESEMQLSSVIPHTGSLKNPIDITFTKNPFDYFSTIPGILINDENTDILLIYILMPSKTISRALESMGIDEEQIENQAHEMIKSFSNSLSQIFNSVKKPIIGFSYQPRDDELLNIMEQSGIPVLPGPHRAARAIMALVKYTHIRERYKQV